MPTAETNPPAVRIAVVIPAFKVTAHVLQVIQDVPGLVDSIYVVDDACPEGSGKLVERDCQDPRVKVVFLEKNQGVGGAVLAGYQAAIADDATIMVKVDGDGQMDPKLIPAFVQPIVDGEADYTKGNRFYDLRRIRAMPAIRIFGNAALSLLSKLSTGYWDLFDPTNGYTAIHTDVARHLPFDGLALRYFFESDVLFRLNAMRARVVDVPMNARYADEVSNLRVRRILGEFLFKHLRNFGKRVFYNYYLREMSLASLELPLGALLLGFGVIHGIWHWIYYASIGESAPTGTVVLAATTALVGLQFVMAFVNYDISSVPRRAIHQRFSSALNRE